MLTELVNRANLGKPPSATLPWNVSTSLTRACSRASSYASSIFLRNKRICFQPTDGNWAVRLLIRKKRFTLSIHSTQRKDIRRSRVCLQTDRGADRSDTDLAIAHQIRTWGPEKRVSRRDAVTLAHTCTSRRPR